MSSNKTIIMPTSESVIDFLNISNILICNVKRMFTFRHYHQCYMSLLEIRTFDTNIYEVKVVAAYIVYKISRLLFGMKRARDALTQFNSHINVFKSMIGPPELMFEHYAWLSKQ